MGMWIRGQELSMKARNIGPNEQWWFLSIKNVAVWACISETFSKGVESVEDPFILVLRYMLLIERLIEQILHIRLMYACI